MRIGSESKYQGGLMLIKAYLPIHRISFALNEINTQNEICLN